MLLCNSEHSVSELGLEMNVDKVVKYWTESAAEDWPVAKQLLESGTYRYALFFGHLYLEKLLKALVVSRTGEHARRTHDLLVLAEHAGLSVSSQQREALLRVTAYNVDTRYPEDVVATRRRYTREHTENELRIIEETGQWLKSELNQEKP